WAVLDYWLKNKKGADFLCFDYGLVDYHDPHAYTQAEKMKLTRHFGEIVRQLRERTDLPIVISEFYGGSDVDDPDFTAANHASCYRHAIINGASLALVWNPEQGEIENYLFTDTEKSGGGRPTPHYDVFLAVRDFFSDGTQLVEAVSSSEDVEVLSSAAKTMLINKIDGAVKVFVNGQLVDLKRYQVMVMDTPAGTGINRRSGVNGTSYVRGTELFVTPPRFGQIGFCLYNIRGRLVASFFRQGIAGKAMVIQWPVETKILSSGVYFISIQGAGLSEMKKLYYIKKGEF
ncbi:T9SS type A sorting domain-containing protein, partial [candidate division KSB1 bacterium]|nr:T9SS type A sorting domain-containing protein [candidate division KSB1 bacterium]